MIEVLLLLSQCSLYIHAALDEDFMLITRIVRFMACQMMSCVEVPIIEDDIAEDVEVFNVLLEQTPGFDTHISLQEMEETITIVDMKGVFLGMLSLYNKYIFLNHMCVTVFLMYTHSVLRIY